MKDYIYHASCVDLSTTEDVKALTLMVSIAKPITLQTFRKRAEGLELWREERHYAKRRKDGPTLGSDWAIGFYKSTFRGYPCYYIRWSAIEFIWVKWE
jgi:hypothetical protein